MAPNIQAAHLSDAQGLIDLLNQIIETRVTTAHTDPFDCGTPRHAYSAPQSQRLRSKATGRPQGAFVAIGIGKLSSGSPVMFNDRDRNPFAAQFIACGLQVGDIEPKFGCVFFCRFYPNMRCSPGSIIK